MPFKHGAVNVYGVASSVVAFRRRGSTATVYLLELRVHQLASLAGCNYPSGLFASSSSRLSTWVLLEDSREKALKALSVERSAAPSDGIPAHRDR